MTKKIQPNIVEDWNTLNLMIDDIVLKLRQLEERIIVLEKTGGH